MKDDKNNEQDNVLNNEQNNEQNNELDNTSNNTQDKFKGEEEPTEEPSLTEEEDADEPSLTDEEGSEEEETDVNDEEGSEEETDVNDEEYSEEETDVTDEEDSDEEYSDEPSSTDETEVESKAKPIKKSDVKQVTKGKKSELLTFLMCLGLIGIVSIVLLIGSKLVKDKDPLGLEKARNDNAYIELQVGNEEFIYYMYNSKGEVVVESQYGTEFINKEHESIGIVDNKIETVKRLDPLSEIEVALGVAGVEQTKATVETSDNSKAPNIKQYTITLEGEEQIKEAYSEYGEEYLASLFEVLNSNQSLEGVAEATEDKVEPTADQATDTEKVTEQGNIKIKFTLLVDKDADSGLSVFKQLVTTDGTEYFDWAFANYQKLTDWSLPSEWAKDKLSSLTVDQLKEQAEGIVKGLQVNMLTALEKTTQLNALDTSQVGLGKYTAKEETEKESLIGKALEELQSTQYSITKTRNELKEKLDELSKDSAYKDLSLVSSILKVADENGWLGIKEDDSLLLDLATEDEKAMLEARNSESVSTEQTETEQVTTE